MYYKVLITQAAYNHLRSIKDGANGIAGIVCARSNSTPLFKLASEKSASKFVVATDAILAKSDCGKMNYLVLIDPDRNEYVNLTFSTNQLVRLIKTTSKRKCGRLAPRRFGRGIVRNL